jgi:hypothetical protein
MTQEIKGTLCFSCAPSWIAAEAQKTGAPSLPRFSMLAYTGIPMTVGGWRHPVVVDLAGMKIPNQRRPIRMGHDSDMGVGHTESVTVDGKNLTAVGVISRNTDAARDVASSGINGFPWQASIGASVLEHEHVPEGECATVNGSEVDGPVNVITKSVLCEISFVDLGADCNTSASVSATFVPSTSENDMGLFSKKPKQAETAPVEAAKSADPATEMEVSQVLTVQSLAGLIASEPAHATMIAELATSGKDEPAIVAAVSAAKDKDKIEAAAKRLEEMTSKLAAAEKALSDEKAAHAATADSLAKIKAHATSHQDPGNGGGTTSNPKKRP